MTSMKKHTPPLNLKAMPEEVLKTKSVVLSNVELRGLTVNVGVKGITEMIWKGNIITHIVCYYI